MLTCTEIGMCPFGPESRFAGPTTADKSANSGVVGARDRKSGTKVLPANSHFQTSKSTRLKIVVSRVRVPVSPLMKVLQSGALRLL
jgi:hypothetical protein